MPISEQEAELTRVRPVSKAFSSYGWPIAVAAMAVFYLATSIYIAAHRLFWYDELFTVLISRLPNATTILDALSHADNNMPAPYFLVVHAFLKLLPQAEVAARLPSALAWVLGLLITADCARRLTDSLHGLMAAALLSCTLTPYYGYEARSYGIYFMFAALGFWVWSQTRKESWSAAALFGAILCAGVLFHYYMVLCLVPFAAGEAVHWKPWRLPSPKLLAGALGIAGAAALLARQVFGANKYGAVFWSKPTLYGLRGVFSELIPDGLFLLALLMILIALRGPERNTAVAPMQAAESAGWLCLLIPFAGYLLALSVTNAFVARYFLGMMPGLAIAFACWFHRQFPGAPRVSTGVLLLLTAVGLYGQLAAVRHPESIQQFDQQTQTRRMLELENGLRSEGKRYFLCSTGMLYVELDYYSSQPGDYRLLIPPEKDLQALNTVRYAMGLARYYPFRFWTLEDLKLHARETALIQPSATTLNLLESAGIRSITRYRGSLEVAYLE
jgi:uncharacterized membrane protein